MSAWTYDASNEANLMKVKYGKLIDKQFNQANVLFGRMKVKKDFVGSQIERPIIQSIGGGVSAGSLPTANESKTAKATITSKKLYAVARIDRETKAAAKTDEGSFVRMTAFPVKAATQAFNRNIERQLIRNDVAGAGKLITGAADSGTPPSDVSGAGTSGDPYVISFDKASTYSAGNFEAIEIGDIVHVNSETTELEVVDMSVTLSGGYATGTVSVVGTSARLAVLADACCPLPFIQTDSLYMQQSKDNELFGLQGILSATSGSLYGVSVGRRWQAYQKDASAAISTDLLNDLIINVKRQCGVAPKMILMGYHQYIKFLNLLEDQKTYNLPARDKKFKGQVSFSAIEYLGPEGKIPVLLSRFMDDDKVYALNEDHIEMCLRPGGFEWFSDDGSVFLRETTDSYEARYGGYGQVFVNPHFQGYLYNLSR